MFCSSIECSTHALIIDIAIRKCPQPYRGPRAGQIVFANIKRILNQRGKVNDSKNIRTMNYLNAR